LKGSSCHSPVSIYIVWQFVAIVAGHAVLGALEGAYASGSLAVKLELKVVNVFARLIKWIASRVCEC